MLMKPEMIVPWINSGVHGYMLKSEKNADFGVAIRKLYQYGHKFTPEVARGLAVSIRRNGEEIIKSEREREIP